MPYAAINDLLIGYRPIYTMIGVDSGTQVLSTDITSYYIPNAESIMNAYLAKRYAVPVASEPIITQIATDLSLFNMMAEKLPEVPDFMQARYDRAMKLLEGLSDGTLTLSSATVIGSGDQEAWSTTQQYHSIFSPVLDPLDQHVDIDRIDADLAEREADHNESPC